MFPLLLVVNLFLAVFRLKKIQKKKTKERVEKEIVAAERKAQGLIMEEAANLLEDDQDQDLLFND